MRITSFFSFHPATKLVPLLSKKTTQHTEEALFPPVYLFRLRKSSLNSSNRSWFARDAAAVAGLFWIMDTTTPPTHLPAPSFAAARENASKWKYFQLIAFGVRPAENLIKIFSSFRIRRMLRAAGFTAVPQSQSDFPV